MGAGGRAELAFQTAFRGYETSILCCRPGCVRPPCSCCQEAMQNSTAELAGSVAQLTHGSVFSHCASFVREKPQGRVKQRRSRKAWNR